MNAKLLRIPVWIHAMLIVLAALTIYPIVFMIVNALKTGEQTTASPFVWPAHPLWINFALALQATGPAYGRTVFIVVVSVFGMLACALLASYAFAKLEFPEREWLFYAIFGLLMIPSFLTLIPLFLEIKSLNLLNNVWGLILPYIAGGQAFCIFILRSFIRAIPDELFDAARIDGAGDIRVFRHLVVPLSVPVLVTLATLNIVSIWSDYILPSLVMNTNHETVAMAVAAFVPPPQAPALNAFNMQLAAFTISSLPILVLFLFLMRYFVAGITSGALKM